MRHWRPVPGARGHDAVNTEVVALTSVVRQVVQVGLHGHGHVVTLLFGDQGVLVTVVSRYQHGVFPETSDR